jgi:diguanylate cyclase (GGDEF)-like protein/PAS domain S-box-containing protein
MVPVFLAAWAFGRRGLLAVLGALLGAHLLLALLSPVFRFTADDFAWAALIAVAGAALAWLCEHADGSQKELEGLELRYERALNESTDVLWEWEINAGSAFFSGRWPELLGYSESELSARISEWFDRVHPEDIGALKLALESYQRGASERFENVHRLRCKDGTYVWVAAGGVLSRDSILRMTGWITDVTERRRSEAQLRRLALQDALTGLPNRMLFLDRLEQAHERARRKQRDYAVLLVDLDRFKVINDSLGHAIGDLLLISVARILKDIVRPGDTIARLGGDEFVILLEGLEHASQADQIAAEVISALVQPIEVEGQRVVVGASVGMSRATGPHEQRRPEDALREADIAMYHAKAMGGERVDSFNPAAYPNLVERLDLETELRKALDGETLHVHYQPIVDLETGVAVGFEALARWQHPRLGMVSPGKFIPVAEETGLIEQLGECVMRIACRDAAALRRAFPEAPAFRMGVNLSVAQLGSADLCDRVQRTLSESGLPADYLSLEITESGLLEDAETAARVFAELRAKGVRLAMDDFGTGYSSLHYLRRFRIDTLKIDGSFVRDLEHTTGQEICATIANLGNDLGLSVIAEGVERQEQVQRLRRLGVRYVQGFLFCRPISFEQLSAWLSSSPQWRVVANTLVA